MLIRRSSVQRAGFSLLEVLVATFLMSIGLISLLVLFPYGALQMAQAIKDDRAAYCADAAHVQAMLFWRETWQGYQDVPMPPVPPVPNPVRGPDGMPFWWGDKDYQSQIKNIEPAFAALDDPEDLVSWAAGTDAGNVAFAADTQKIPAGYVSFTRPSPSLNPEIFTPAPGNPEIDPPPYSRRSYPLFIDPSGWEAHRRNNLFQGRDWVAGQGGTGSPYRRIARRTLKSLNPYYPGGTPNPAAIVRASTLLDDISFSSLGSAIDPDTGIVNRAGKYSWSYLIRREPYSRPWKVSLTVLVYTDRRIDTATQEEAWGATITPNSTSISVLTNGARPYIRKGGWIMDASRTGTGATVQQNAKFYRVTQITETATTFELELASPIQSNFAATPTTGGLIYLFDTDLGGRLIEVFDRGSLDITGDPQP